MSHLSALARLQMLTRAILRSPRSTAPTYVLWRSLSSASFSWENPLSCLSLRRLAPKVFVGFTRRGYILNSISLHSISSTLHGCFFLE